MPQTRANRSGRSARKPASAKGRARRAAPAQQAARLHTARTELRHRKIFEDAIAAARTIAADEGLDGLTARRIARTIGCSVGTLYNVFESFDTLILYLNAETFDALFDVLDGLALPDDPEQAVRLMVYAYLGFIRDNANLWNVIFDHLWPKDYEIPAWYTDKTQRLLGLLSNGLAPMFTTSQHEQKIHAAIVLWGGLHGITSLANSGKLGFLTTETINVLADEMIANVLAGVKRRYGAAGNA